MQKLKGIYLLMLLGLITSCSSVKQQKSGIESWIHVHPSSLKTNFKSYKEFGERAKQSGYTTIVIRFTNSRGYDKDAAKALISYYKNDLGLNVIPEFKLLGKSKKTYGNKFLKEHPELFEGEVLDPYAIYKGKPAYDTLIIPLVDEHIELFDNPSYFCLGWDEYNTDNIKKVADRNNKTVSNVWAGTLNRVNDYLLEKNITPIIFGDQLLSKNLAEENNSLGYPADKRFNNFSAMHGVYPPQSKIDMIEFAKDIKNRDKIIMADWHYDNEKEYPSVDYFNWLGFKEVIPVTWGIEENMKNFSKYAQERGSKRMMASVWHYSYHPSVRHLLWPTVDNSILYFNNPDIDIPAKPHISITKNGKPIIAAKPGETITLSLSSGNGNTEFDVYPVFKMLRKNVTTLKSSKPEVEWTIPEDAKEGFWTIQGYSKREDGYLYHGMLESGLYISNKPMTEKRVQDGAFISVDFSDCLTLGKDNKNILLNGKSKTTFGIIEGDACIKNDALRCKKGGLLVGRSNSDCESITKEKTVMLEFKIDKFPGEKQAWAGLLTWGHYGSGFRIIIWEKKLFVQIFQKGAPKVYLTSQKNLELNKKYFVVYNENQTDATLTINGVEQMRKAVDNPVKIPVTDLLSVGCSFKGRLWKCFNGEIYKFAIWNKFVDANKNK